MAGWPSPGELTKEKIKKPAEWIFKLHFKQLECALRPPIANYCCNTETERLKAGNPMACSHISAFTF